MSLPADVSAPDAQLAPQQARLVERIVKGDYPTRYDLADALDVAPNTIKAHIRRVREKGVPIEYDAEEGGYGFDDNIELFLSPAEAPSPDVAVGSRVPDVSPSKANRATNEFARAAEEAVLARLEADPRPIRAPASWTRGNEDVVFAIGDTHFGDVVEKDTLSGPACVYNTPMAGALMDHYTARCLRILELMNSMTDFDTGHIVFTGDMVTGIGIYPGQEWHLDGGPADQLSAAVAAMYRLVEAVAHVLPSVTVTCIPGNHGRLKMPGAPRDANWDIVAYLWLRDRIRDTGLDNVTFHNLPRADHLVFPVRGGKWRGYARHGDGTPVHVDATAASRALWRGWHNASRFDFAIRGHHHTARREDVLSEFPVFTAPSMKPGADFADRIGMPDVSTVRKLGWMFGSSDTRPVTWDFLIDDSDLPADSPAQPQPVDLDPYGIYGAADVDDAAA